MKKFVLILVLIIGLFSIFKVNVNAEVLKTTKKYDNVVIDYLDDKGDFANCDGLLTPEGLDMIREVLNWVRILAPILLIVFVAFDFASAVVSHDNDAISKASKKIVPRMIGTALLFFVPTIIRAILNIQGIRDAIVIPDDPLCHTMASEKVVPNYNIAI